MSHEDPYRPNPGRDRGAYTPPTDDDLPFNRQGYDPRRSGGGGGGGGGGKAPPMTLIISAVVLLVLIIAVVVYYRAGPRASGDAPPAVGTPVGEMKGDVPLDAQPVDPTAGIEVYADNEAPATAPTFVPPPEEVQPRPAPAPVETAPVPTTPPPAKKAEPAPAATGGTSAVQIGAFSTPNLAEREYNAVVGRYPQLTEGGSRRVQEVTTSSGSTVYRTTVNGLSREQATGLCNAIKASGGGLHRPVTRSAAIYGCSGHRLTEDEKAFFAEVRPWGFIVFRRNVDSPDQMRALTDEMRDCVGDAGAPVLIDQEGGRVQRMGPPHWAKYPPAAAYLEAADGLLRARELVRLGARLMANDLRAVGVNVDCAPVLDVPVPGAHDIIGDRAYARDPATVAILGRAAAEGLLAGGVLPVIKHMPGHGRAFADSHKALPVVHAGLEALEEWDFAPFRALSDMPLAMTAHVVFDAVDPKQPATTSKKAVKLMRGGLGFGGLIMTDDLSMKALSGSLRERAEAALKAGCDVVLHCNGELNEMRQVAEGVGKLKGKAGKRAEAALARIVREVEPLDVFAARDRFDALMAGRVEAAKGPDVGEAQA